MASGCGWQDKVVLVQKELAAKKAAAFIISALDEVACKCVCVCVCAQSFSICVRFKGKNLTLLSLDSMTVCAVLHIECGINNGVTD